MVLDLNGLAERMLAVTRQREANGASIKTDPLSMLKHTATEVVEATEAFSSCCLVSDEVRPSYTEKFAGELADIVACVMIIASSQGIDLAEALRLCYEKNKKRADGVGDKK